MHPKRSTSLEHRAGQLAALAWRFGLPEAIVFSMAGVTYFYNAFRFSLPTGYGGLFGLMSEEILAGRFALPVDVANYGPGGIPFAYPPIGLYLAALVQHLAHVSYLDYARWGPAFLSVVFVVAFYWLGRATLHNRGAALAAAVLVAAAGEVFGNQATASGVVRSVAGVWTAGACALAELAYRAERRRAALVIGAGVLFGLLLATHLSYAVVGALGILAMGTLRGRKSWWRNALTGAGILSIGVLVSSPWWGTVWARHGAEVFVSALQTHGNTGVLSHINEGLLAVLKLAGGWILNLGVRWSPAPLVGLALLGLGFAIVKGRWALVGWFAAVLLFTGEPDRYLAMIGSLMAGDLIAEVVRPRIQQSPTEQQWPNARLGQWAAAGLILSVVWWQGFKIARSVEPVLTNDDLDLGAWFQDKTPQSAAYLFISSQHDLSEWMPFLLRRTPATAPWGSEWIGRYSVESRRFDRLGECADAQSWVCVTAFLQDEGLSPDYLVVPSAMDPLVSELEADPAWVAGYGNGTYRTFTRSLEG